jgi:hypothetical protein
VASNAGGMAWRRPQSPGEVETIPAGYGWSMPGECDPMMRDEPLFEEIMED